MLLCAPIVFSGRPDRHQDLDPRGAVTLATQRLRLYHLETEPLIE